MAGRKDDPGCGSLDAQLERFAPPFRKRLADCAGLSVRVGQLGQSYPVLLFALATNYGPLPTRKEVIRRAVKGRPVRELASQLRLPLCFRRLPPEACRKPLPYVAWSKGANRRLASFVPDDPERAATWLRGVNFTALTAGEPFAYWLAQRQFARARENEIERIVLPLAIYAWHSEHADADSGLRPTEQWHADVGWKASVDRCRRWLRRLDIAATLGDNGVSDPWIAGGPFGGLEFHPITTAQDLIDEAAAMHNCVESYGRQLAIGHCPLFSVRRDAKRIATLEIRRGPTTQSYSIHQLLGPGNTRCPDDLRATVEAWLATHAPSATPEPRQSMDRRSDSGPTFENLLEPWREARGLENASWARGLTLRSLASALRWTSGLGGD